MAIPDWSGAACLDTDPEAFFPISAHDGEQAKDICDGCRIRQDCLDYAIDTSQQYGIWGGENVEERAAEVRRRNRAARDALKWDYLDEAEMSA